MKILKSTFAAIALSLSAVAMSSEGAIASHTNNYAENIQEFALLSTDNAQAKQFIQNIGADSFVYDLMPYICHTVRNPSLTADQAVNLLTGEIMTEIGLSYLDATALNLATLQTAAYTNVCN